jgi:hypothetical protein
VSPQVSSFKSRISNFKFPTGPAILKTASQTKFKPLPASDGIEFASLFDDIQPKESSDKKMKTQMTIADYFDKARFQMMKGNMGGDGDNSGQSVHNEFENVLKRVSAGQEAASPATLWKRNLADYRANAIKTMARAICPEAPSDASTAGETVLKSEIPIQNVHESPLNAFKSDTNDPEKNDMNKPSEALSKKTTGRQRIDSCIENSALKYNVPKELIQSVIQAESGFRANVVSGSGAMGLMQLMPGTASDLGVSNPFDVEQNIDGGTRYLKKMLDRFDGDVKLALAAYNAGPGAVDKYGGLPPYRETRRYVQRVLNDYQENA